MKLILALLFGCLVFFSCKKEYQFKNTCYKGRFIEDDCWAVIEVLAPLNESLPTSEYRTYKHVIGTGGLPQWWFCLLNNGWGKN